MAVAKLETSVKGRYPDRVQHCHETGMDLKALMLGGVALDPVVRTKVYLPVVGVLTFKHLEQDGTGARVHQKCHQQKAPRARACAERFGGSIPTRGF